MSRTYKDTPLWVQGARTRNRRINHDWYCEDNPEPRSWARHYLDKLHPCNVDDNRSRSYGAGHQYLCEWDFPVWDHRTHCGCRGVPAWYINHHWNAPSRQEERLKLDDAVKQYRGTGEIDDIVFEHDYHRHTSGGNYW